MGGGVATASKDQPVLEAVGGERITRLSTGVESLVDAAPENFVNNSIVSDECSVKGPTRGFCTNLPPPFVFQDNEFFYAFFLGGAECCTAATYGISGGVVQSK